MPRRLIFIALIASLLMQAGALGSWVQQAAGAQHSLWHWVGLSHHHHASPAFSAEDLAGFEALGDLGIPASAYASADSIHADPSPEAHAHLLLDQMVGGAALLPCATPAPAPLPPSTGAPCPRVERAPASAFIEGLRRPPRPTA